MAIVNKLSFSDVLSESFRFFFGHIRLFFHLVTIPWLMSLAIRVIAASLGGDDDDATVLSLLEKFLDVVPTVMFLVAWTRVVLLGPQRVGMLPGRGWSRRETAFLIHLMQIAGVTYLLVAAFTLAIGPVDPMTFAAASSDPEVVHRQALAAPLGLGFIVSAMLALRVCYGLAASAVDVPFSPRLSWTYGKGDGWTILVTLFLMFFINAIITTLAVVLTAAVLRGFLGSGLGVTVVVWTVALLVSYAGSALVATAQAIIFRHLLQWREGAALPPPP
jgi:hypothetical protein